MQKILITGGAGFIGNYIVDILQETGEYEIIILDNFSKQVHGEDFNQSFLYKNVKNKAKIILGDVRNLDDLVSALDGVEYIIHLAAETGTGQSMYEINQYSEVNIMGTSNLLDLIANKKLAIKKIILASSRSVYGEGMYHCKTHGSVVPFSREISDMKKGDFSTKCPVCAGEIELLSTNEECPINPISYYAVTKFIQEKMLETMCPALGIDYTIFRYQNVYGAGQSLNNPYTGILSIFSSLFISNRPINIFEDGLESRDFVHASDVARATCIALKNPKTNGQIINIGSGESTTVIDVATTMKRLYRSTSSIRVSGDFRKGDIRHNKADISKLKALCGFQPTYSLERGMAEFTEWVENELSQVNRINSDRSYEKSLEELKTSGILISNESSSKVDL